MNQPQAPKPKKGKSLMFSALESGLDSLNDPAVMVQLPIPVSPPLTPGEATVSAPSAPGADSELNLDQLDPSRDQARTYFDPGELEELAQSIREKGVLQPLLVRPRNGRFQILAGERRWRAAKLAGLERVPVYIRAMDDEASNEISLIENLHRADLNRVEKLEKILTLISNRSGQSRRWAISALRQAWALKQGRRPSGPVATDAELETLRSYLIRLGVGLSSLVVSSLPCLAWPSPVYQAVASGKIGVRFAELIVKQPVPRQDELLILANQLDIEVFTQRLAGEGRPTATVAKTEPLSDGLNRRFGGLASVTSKGQRTTITLVANSEEELSRIKKVLKL